MTATVMPDWLRSMLVDKGYMTREGVTFRARIRSCRDCHLPTVAGIDDNGLTTWCDPGELTPDGELLALLDGRHTWDLYGGSQLTYRRPSAITHRPAGDRRRPVLAEHRCHQPIPASWCCPPRPAPAPAADEGFPF